MLVKSNVAIFIFFFFGFERRKKSKYGKEKRVLEHPSSARNTTVKKTHQKLG